MGLCRCDVLRVRWKPNDDLILVQVYQDSEDLVGEWFKQTGKRDDVSKVTAGKLSCASKRRVDKPGTSVSGLQSEED